MVRTSFFYFGEISRIKKVSVFLWQIGDGRCHCKCIRGCVGVSGRNDEKDKDRIRK